MFVLLNTVQLRKQVFIYVCNSDLIYGQLLVTSDQEIVESNWKD